MPNQKREIFVLSGKVTLFSPEFLLKELIKHKKEIMRKFRLKNEQFELTAELVKAVVRFKPLSKFEEYIDLAKRHSPDVGDVQYLALAMKLALPLWSNDKALKRQSMVKVLSTKEVLAFLSGNVQ
ncbi:MAG: hypothetical protein J7L44_02190 [Candidatus Diapherotrites archaeon]|nr:hypothetical protein [Candidatus Diapherotrites archaeon]